MDLSGLRATPTILISWGLLQVYHLWSGQRPALPCTPDWRTWNWPLKTLGVQCSLKTLPGQTKVRHNVDTYMYSWQNKFFWLNLVILLKIGNNYANIPSPHLGLWHWLGGSWIQSCSGWCPSLPCRECPQTLERTGSLWQRPESAWWSSLAPGQSRRQSHSTEKKSSKHIVSKKRKRWKLGPIKCGEWSTYGSVDTAAKFSGWQVNE